MSYLEQVQRGIDFIEDRLDGELPLASVAKAAGMSRWHFQRIFKALTHETLKSYIRARRLARSLDRLLATDMRIIEIAMAAGYESQESFTRAFKQAFGMTPHAYRRLGDNHRFLKKVQLDADYLEHIHGGVSLEPVSVQRLPCVLVGCRTQFFSVDSHKNNIAETIPPLWASFLPRLGEIPQRLPDICYGVVRPTGDDTDLLEYVAAAPVESASAPQSEKMVPEGMVQTTVPGGMYALFEHRGHTRALDHTVNYVYSTWLLRSGRRHAGSADLEIYGPGYVEDSDASVIHYAIPLAPA